MSDLNKEYGNQKNFNPSSDIQTTYRLVLLNDDVNNFDYVVKCLVKICQFDIERAEQCTLLTHLNGQYAILSGEKSKLESIQNQLNEKNIRTKIDKK